MPASRRSAKPRRLHPMTPEQERCHEPRRLRESPRVTSGESSEREQRRAGGRDARLRRGGRDAWCRRLLVRTRPALAFPDFTLVLPTATAKALVSPARRELGRWDGPREGLGGAVLGGGGLCLATPSLRFPAGVAAAAAPGSRRLLPAAARGEYGKIMKILNVLKMLKIRWKYGKY